MSENESGRGIVKIIAILAVVGVLSVGGIAGYATAMTIHNANEAINNANRFAAIVAKRRAVNPRATLSADDVAGTSFVMIENPNQIILELSGLSDSVRSKIAGTNLHNALIANVDGKITFTFKNDLGEIGTAGK